jgi:hypothetical protein
MSVGNRRLASAGVITATCHAFLARTLAMNPHQGKRMGPHHGETARHGKVFAALLASIVLLMAACTSNSAGPGVANAGSSSAGGSSSTGSGGSAASASTVAYSACMRSHGVTNFPDPGNSGQIPKADAQQLGVSPARLQAAQRACAHLIPNTGSTEEQQQETQCAMADDCSQAVVQQWMSGLRTLAQCLRSHGVPNWPDPIISSQGLPHFPYSEAGIDHHAPQILAKVQVCIRLTGFQGLPLP